MDTMKTKDCESQWVAEDSPGEVSSHSTTDEKVEDLECANSINDSFTEQAAPLQTLASNSMLGIEGVLPDGMDHSQNFQNAKPLNDLANSICFPPLLMPAQSGMFHANHNDNLAGISHSAASPQEAIFYQNRKQVSLDFASNELQLLWPHNC